MRLKIKVITQDEELFFDVPPAIYEIFNGIGNTREILKQLIV